MSRGYLHQFRLLFARLGILYLLYFFCRLLFFGVNQNHFEGGMGRLPGDLFFGLWFDSFSIAAANILFIFLSAAPPALFTKDWFQHVLKWLFVVTNSVFIAFNLIDVAYFPFTRKRSTADLFKQLGGQSDIGKLLPQFLAEYWWLFLLFAMCVYGMVILYGKTQNLKPRINSLKENRITSSLALTLTLTLTFLAIRGGLQRNPIDIVNAGAVTTPERAPIVLNTPFTLIKTLRQEPLPELHYFQAEEVRHIYNPVHHYDSLVPGGSNVVVLLLESFSKEYCMLGKKKSFTPFFDSLMGHSLVFTNAFANCSKSIEGIPAVLSSLPSYMELPSINSMYANNSQTSFASLLGKEGYETAFFHGGNNGTMNFVEWSRMAGYTRYFGRDEYNNEADFDGYWGIWDEPFLQYAVTEMSGFRQPFHSAVFTLSSHHPYRIPPKYENKFPKGKEAFEAALLYADHSLKRFFEAASQTSWYKNTLFVLVADHAIISDRYLDNPLANHTIPVAFFRPDNSLKGTNESVFFQIDILPQAMQLIGYNKPFFSFGKDPSKTKDHLGIYYGDGYYSVFTDSMLVNYLGAETRGVYNYLRDSALHQNVLGRYPELEALVEKNFRAMIQTYNHTLNSNGGRVGG